MENIRIGTMIDAVDAPKIIPQIQDYGFECFSLVFQETEGVDMKDLASRVKDAIGDRDIVISTVTTFGNPLKEEKDIKTWERLIDNAPLFGTNIVSGWAGRIPNVPVPESIPKFKEVFTPLAQRAQDKGELIAFENCDMDGTWFYGDFNIAFCVRAWELMFDAVPYDNLGLEWEPCHQLYNLVDPIRQLRKWAKKIYHLHGKDATVDYDLLAEVGRDGCDPGEYAKHRTPGFGDSNWTDIISILRMNGYKGTIDIEGFHDPAYSGEWEMTGQVYALNYLKQCRGGDFVPNYVR